MPLVGVVDPSHDSWQDRQDGIPPRWLPQLELLAVAEQAGPDWSPWPYELLQAALAAQQDRDYISTTMLTGGCSRSKVIERREDFIGTLDGMYAALRGTQIHRTLEFAVRSNAVAEARFFTDFHVRGKKERVEVSCSPDIVDHTSLGDYKVTENPPVYKAPWKSHTAQVNINSYIVRHAKRWETPEDYQGTGFTPELHRPTHLYLVYLGPKGPKTMVCTKAQPVTYKNGNTGTRQLPYVWDDDEVEDYLLPRLTGMVKALDSYPDWPVDLGEYPGFEGPEGWRCPGKPWCNFPDCLAKRWPDGLVWESP
jgi:hypothetical protein